MPNLSLPTLPSENCLAKIFFIGGHMSNPRGFSYMLLFANAMSDIKLVSK